MLRSNSALPNEQMIILTRGVEMAVPWDRLLVYRDEVPSSAVDVNIVVIHSDHFVGLCHEESSAAELRTLRGEGELTLHCDHVQAA